MSLIDTGVLPPELDRFLRRRWGDIVAALVVLAIVVGGGLGLTYGMMSFYKHNPAYPLERYRAKAGEQVSLVCQRERPTMDLDTCFAWVQKHNEPQLVDGLQADELILLPNGR
jgi:hypothetical protein